MNKLWTIAWKELYTRFTDRNLILIMIATPLALSTIMGLAFGGLGSGNAPVSYTASDMIGRSGCLPIAVRYSRA